MSRAGSLFKISNSVCALQIFFLSVLHPRGALICARPCPSTSTLKHVHFYLSNSADSIQPFPDRPRPQSVANLEFLLLAMGAIGVRHPITNHFTAQLELDMDAAGINDQVPLPCPAPVFDKTDTRNISLSGILADRRNRSVTVEDLTSSSPSPSGHVTLTQVLEDLTNSNIAAGFHEKDPAHAYMHPVVPYFVREMNRREKEMDTDQNNPKVSNDKSTESTTAWASQASGETGFQVSSDPFRSFDQVPGAPMGDTPSSDSSSSNMMQGTPNKMQPNSNTTQYPFRHIDPSNRGTKSYGIFQADLTSYQDSPGWGMQEAIPGFNHSGQGGDGLQDDFSGFDINGQSGVEFHGFIGDGSWNTGPLPE
jgi:hypothetical protein